jgi:hypothetical protein
MTLWCHGKKTMKAFLTKKAKAGFIQFLKTPTECFLWCAKKTMKTQKISQKKHHKSHVSAFMVYLPKSGA